MRLEAGGEAEAKNKGGIVGGKRDRDAGADQAVPLFKCFQSFASNVLPYMC